MMLRNRMINNNEDGCQENNEELNNTAYEDSNNPRKNKISFFTIIVDNSYNIFVICFNYIYKGIKIFIKISGVYLLWICLHYIASQLYIELCVPKSVFGFLISPFMTSTPQCQGLRWIVYNAANMINNMWLLLGTWICSTLLLLTNSDVNVTK
jgi:hypothetical protein